MAQHIRAAIHQFVSSQKSEFTDRQELLQIPIDPLYQFDVLILCGYFSKWKPPRDQQ